MSQLSKHHEELTNGVGKCSVPMWENGCPAGFCDNDAYSKRPKGEQFMNYSANEMQRVDGRYNGYVTGLACSAHGGLTKEQVLNLCDFCEYHIATCKSNPMFGTGKGNDNVYECETWIKKEWV